LDPLTELIVALDHRHIPAWAGIKLTSDDRGIRLIEQRTDSQVDSHRPQTDWHSQHTGPPPGS
jgi:hypothetical protein